MLLASRPITHVKPQHSTEHGNVLFLILIAVVLFAALSYAVTNSNRSSGDVSTEQAKIYAAQVIDYSTHILQVVQRLMIANGCTREQISFSNPFDIEYANPSAPSDGKCDVFGLAGGGASFHKGPEQTGDANGYPIFIAARILGIGVDTGANSREVNIFFPIRSLAICSEINKRLGLSPNFAIDGITTASALNSLKYKGTNLAGNVIPDEAGNLADYRAQHNACIQSTTNVTQYPSSEGIGYFYYHVLILG